MNILKSDMVLQKMGKLTTTGDGTVQMNKEAKKL